MAGWMLSCAAGATSRRRAGASPAGAPAPAGAAWSLLTRAGEWPDRVAFIVTGLVWSEGPAAGREGRGLGWGRL